MGSERAVYPADAALDSDEFCGKLRFFCERSFPETGADALGGNLVCLAEVGGIDCRYCIGKHRGRYLPVQYVRNPRHWIPAVLLPEVDKGVRGRFGWRKRIERSMKDKGGTVVQAGSASQVTCLLARRVNPERSRKSGTYV